MHLTSSKHLQAFSLVEVVLALGIVVFAGFALIGLMVVAVQGTRDSKEQLQAATLAESICSTLRATPSSNYSSSAFPQQGFPLPYITNSASNFTTTPVYLTWDGVATTKAQARFGLYYSVTAPSNYTPVTSPGAAVVYLSFFWPAAASSVPVNSAGHFEITSTFALP